MRKYKGYELKKGINIHILDIEDGSWTEGLLISDTNKWIRYHIIKKTFPDGRVVTINECDLARLDSLTPYFINKKDVGTKYKVSITYYQINGFGMKILFYD